MFKQVLCTLLIAGGIATGSSQLAVWQARAQRSPFEPCTIRETEISNSSPPNTVQIDLCAEIDITVNVSGIRPTLKEPTPSVASTDGQDAALGPLFYIESEPALIGTGQSVRILKIWPTRQGTGEITFYQFNGQVRAITKVTVVR